VYNNEKYIQRLKEDKKNFKKVTILKLRQNNSNVSDASPMMKFRDAGDKSPEN